MEKAFAPMATTLTLEDEIDISRGDMIVKSSEIPEVASKLEVMVVWMDEKPLELKQNYIIKRATSVINGSFQAIEYKKDVNTFEKIPTQKLELNDIAKCELSLDRAIAVDPYDHNRYTGSFIIIDRYTNSTVGAGMIIAKSDDVSQDSFHEYSEFEIELNALVRKHFPHWEAKEIL